MAEVNNPVDISVLKGVLDCIIKPKGYGEPIRALKILVGPYQGVVFSYTTFKFLQPKGEDIEKGMAPVRFETQIHQAPDGFVQDEGFDQYCSDILLAWLQFISDNDLDMLLSAKTTGVH